MLKIFLGTEILFSGYYGQKNTGDDAFVEVASWGAEKFWNKKSSIFLAKEKALPLTVTATKGYPLTLPRSYNIQRKLLIPYSDYLISAGGSTIYKEFTSYNAELVALQEKKKNSKIKIGAIGVSVGPFETIKDEKSVIKYLKEIDFLAVRDQESFNFVKSLELPYEPVNAFDLAALLPYIYTSNNVKILSEKKVIGISVCPVESISDISKIKNEMIRNTKTVELIKELDKSDNVHFKFLIINGNSLVGDANTTKEIIKRASPKSFEIVEYNKETQKMWNEILSCDFVVSTRLHAAIFACFSGTPFMLNEYHRKCEDFLENVGYDEKLRLFDNQYEPSKIACLILDILNDYSNYKHPVKIEEMKDKAKLNFTGVTL